MIGQHQNAVSDKHALHACQVLLKNVFIVCPAIKRSSTSHALVHFVHSWLADLEIPNTIIRTCLIDFLKAFDRVGHNILMRKLSISGLPPVLSN